MNVDRALDYHEFVSERHKVWLARQAGAPAPWTDNPILAAKKFTNVFRILDPGTQIVMRDGFMDGELADVAMRCFLYRHTGRVEVWDHTVAELLGQPTIDDLEDVYEILMEYRGESKAMTCGNSTRGGPSRQGRKFERAVFTGAYLVFPQSQVPGTDKVRAIVDLTKRLFTPGSPDYVVDDFVGASPAAAFAALVRNKGVGNFTSMQVLTDWGYGPGQLDDTFVIAGPGAVKGAAELGLKPNPAIEWCRANLPDDVFLTLPDGRRHYPSAMDVQNTLCEFFKFVRYLKGDPFPRAAYKPAHPGAQTPPVLPTHW